MSSKNYRKIFHPTTECILMGGEDAITSFTDNSEKETPDKHLVVISTETLEQLSSTESQGTPIRTSIEDARMKQERAGEVLRFINERLPLGFKEDQDYQVADSLFLRVSNQEMTKLKEESKHVEVVCKYEGERLRYQRSGLDAKLARFARIDPNIRREGIVHVEDDKLFDELSAEMNKNGKTNNMTAEVARFNDFIRRTYPNQYLVINRSTSEEKPLVGHVIGDIEWNERGGTRTHFMMGDLEVRIQHSNELMQQQLLRTGNSKGLMPRNLEQAIYMHAMRQEHIAMIFVTGGAGTGKTVVGYGAGLAQALPYINPESPVMRQGAKSKSNPSLQVKDKELQNTRFRELYLVKSNDLIGGKERDPGFLPGDEREKLAAGLESYITAHQALRLPISFYDLEAGLEDKAERIDGGLFRPAHPVIRIQNYARWRGVTRENAVVFLDEAQNLTPVEMKHLLQRMGGGSLYVISGDYEDQIDNARMHSTYNGLFAGIKNFIGQPYVAVINLEENQRHMGAEHAGKMRLY